MTVSIRALSVVNFKGFSSYRLNLKPGLNLLVGPNSAGKSTLLSGLRLYEACARYAMRVKPHGSSVHEGRSVISYPVPTAGFEILHESVSHEFRGKPSRLTVELSNRAKLTIVWTHTDPPFFYVESSPGIQPRTVSDVRRALIAPAVVPSMAPLEQEEQVLSPEYVKKHQSSRLSGRHFRNNLRLLHSSGEEQLFQSYCAEWAPELQLGAPQTRYTGDGTFIDLFYSEAGSHAEKELVWAGDGYQVWLQLLWHLARHAGAEVVLLDEPEVFLHPDLQRRLVRLCGTLSVQIVCATHSAEMLAEAHGDAVVWVDRTRRTSVRAPADRVDVGTGLGTQFNLGLAKALRSRAILFVEGKDVKILRGLSGALGLKRLAEERVLATIPLNGYANWDRLEPFKWFTDTFLEGAVKTYVLLDRDYRSGEQVVAVKRALDALGIQAHVWRRKEIESYLLDVALLARVTGAPGAWLESELKTACSAQENYIMSRFVGQKLSELAPTGIHPTTITENAKNEFDQLWSDEDRRLEVAPPKELLHQLNANLSRDGFKTISIGGLLRCVTPADIPDEVKGVLAAIDSLPT